jgi:hypothetical protein
MPNAQGPGLCSTSVDKKDDHVCSMLVHVVCCNLIQVFFFLIYDQCSPELKNKLEGTEGYNGAKNTNDVAKLLTMIRRYCCQFDLLSNEYMAISANIKTRGTASRSLRRGGEPTAVGSSSF